MSKLRQIVIPPQRDWGLCRIINILPGAASWRQWVVSTARFLRQGEYLLQVDLGVGGIQLSIGSQNASSDKAIE